MFERVSLLIREARSGALRQALRRHLNNAGDVWIACGIGLGSLLLLGVLTSTGVITSPYMPSPGKIFGAFNKFLHPDLQDQGLLILFERHSFVEHVALTTLRGYACWALAFAAGLTLGLYFGKSRWFGFSFKCFVVGMASVSKLFWSMMLVGGLPFYGPLLGEAGVITLGIGAVFTFAGNAAYEIGRDYERYDDFLEAARVDGATSWQCFYYIRLGIAKYPLTGALTWSLIIAMATVYFAEYVLSPTGIGQITSMAAHESRIPEMWAIMLVGEIVNIPGLILIVILMGGIPTRSSRWVRD